MLYYYFFPTCLTNLALSMLKVYLSTIMAHQPPDSKTALLFRHPKVKRFLRGVAHLIPPQLAPIPQWSFHTVLNRLTCPPFEPLAMCSEHLLSYKVLFLVTITSARRASELMVLCVDPSFLQFHLDKIPYILTSRSFPRFVWISIFTNR